MEIEPFRLWEKKSDTGHTWTKKIKNQFWVILAWSLNVTKGSRWIKWDTSTGLQNSDKSWEKKKIWSTKSYETSSNLMRFLPNHTILLHIHWKLVRVHLARILLIAQDFLKSCQTFPQVHHTRIPQLLLNYPTQTHIKCFTILTRIPQNQMRLPLIVWDFPQMTQDFLNSWENSMKSCKTSTTLVWIPKKNKKKHPGLFQILR